MDKINDYWQENDAVVNITELNDPNQPYSCSQWGNQYSNSHNSSGGGSQGNSHEPPLMVSGPNMGMWSMFNTGSAFPSNVFIDHTMQVFQKVNNVTSSVANGIIQDMLDVMENGTGKAWMVLVVRNSSRNSGSSIERKWNYGLCPELRALPSLVAD